MTQETVVGLVRDLTTTLSSIAQEFGSRVDQLSSTDVAGPSTSLPRTRRWLAEQILERRLARYDFFPSELFHEPAWDMLLALYVAQADKKIMNVKSLVASASAPVTTSQRWIDHLHKLKLIDRVVDFEDRRRIEISLSAAGEEAIGLYLDRLGASEA